MKKALFVAYGGAHVAMVVPVVEELRRRGTWDVVVLGLTTARAALDRAGIPSLGFKDLAGPGDAEALALGAELARAHHRDGVGVSREESTAYLGLSYADLRARVGADAAKRLLDERGRRAFLPLGPLHALIERSRPDVVVATNSPRSEEAALRAARARSVPAVCLVPFASPDLMERDTVSAHANVPGFADRTLVFSEDVRRWLLDRGHAPASVVVTGNPAFESLGDPSLPGRAAAWRRARGLDGRRLLLWASSPEPERPALIDEITRSLIAALDRHPDWHLLHRRHPSEAPPAAPYPPRAEAGDPKEPLDVLLHAADVVIVTVSTVGMEAALAGKPLVKARMSSMDAISPYEAMGVALPAPDLASLEDRVVRALADGPDARALADARRRYPPVAGASKRVADVLEALTS
ncbi:MAG TPA: hypothetical protein VF950_21925 [Planctomycetota bacterium]